VTKPLITTPEQTTAAFWRALDAAIKNPNLTPAQMDALKLRAHMLGLTKADVVAEDFRKGESQ
jgi:hypothetical protein